MQPPGSDPRGAGLGLRRDFLDSIDEAFLARVDFFEVAPENWMEMGGRLGQRFQALTDRHCFATHGLSLSIGAPAPLDTDFVRRIRGFLDQHDIRVYSEHLSYCSDGGHLYDLMPIPFTRAAVDWVADRVKRVQDILGRRLVLENVSYYAAPGQQMAEIDFIGEVLTSADCGLLLDVNNIYVNAVNHGYEPEAFLKALPGERIAYGHIAGHYNEAEDLIVDTHGAEVIEPVWQLLEMAYRTFGVFPTLLERDFNIPSVESLLGEVDRIRQLQARVTEVADVLE